MSKQQKNGSIIAIVTMMFLYAMISFVTNLGAPIGVIWKNQPEIGGSNVLGIMGNFMNFFAYLFMGIPAGKMLTKVGYKKTALIGIAVGFIGVFIQFLSGFSGGISGFCVYLFGAFVSGFSVCILNTVVNPMLNLLGGGGNRGNQLNMIGGTLNSLSGTMTPMLVGALIGTVTAATQMADVNLVMYIAMTVFAAAFCILFFIPIQDPELGKVTADTKFEHSPWSFRHCMLGVIAIFVYVGVEVGIPGGLNFYLSDTSANGAWVNPDAVLNAATIGGAVAAMYWLLMRCGRLVSGFIAGKVSSRQLMLCTTSVAMILILAAMFIPKTNTISMPLFDIMNFKFWSATVPISALLLVLCGLCTSIMWASIFNLATEGLGKYTAQASGIFMMMVVGGGVLPLIQGWFSNFMGYMPSYFVYFLAVAYMFYYALIGCKNVNKDIPVD
jgi:FHS family L-fucose permease-like MFS transporter